MDQEQGADRIAPPQVDAVTLSSAETFALRHRHGFGLAWTVSTAFVAELSCDFVGKALTSPRCLLL